MIHGSVMIIDTPKPLQAHVLGMSSKSPFSSGHKAVITEEDSDTKIMARSMKLGKTYDVQVFNRKKENVDAFVVTYMYSKYQGQNIIIKELGHY